MSNNGSQFGGGDALALEKRRHQEVRDLLRYTEERIGQLQKDIDEKDCDIQEYGEVSRDLKDQLKAAQAQIKDLERQVSTLADVEAKMTMQSEKIASLENELRSSMDARLKIEQEVTMDRSDLVRTTSHLEELKGTLSATQQKLDEKTVEIGLYQDELATARKVIIARDQSLMMAEKERLDLQKALFGMQRQMENNIAVMGEASIALHSEVAKSMSFLQRPTQPGKPYPRR